jgi:CheY-like chemotaxis protein
VILCVDDEPIALLMRQRVLEKAGYEVIPASSVGQALEILEAHSIDLVLTDFLMPLRTGADLATEAKRRWPQIPVVMISGVHEIPEGLAADLFLNKLEGPVYLCEQIGLLLQGNSTAQGLNQQPARPLKQ